MSFQKVVIIIAIILLILALIFFGISIRNNKYTMKFPPVQSQCPDYWEAQENSTGDQVCFNKKNLGNSNCAKTMNFNHNPWIGTDGACNKKKWAENCNIVWDGITNLNGC